MRPREWRWPWRRRRDLADDVRDELDAHVSMQIADLMAEGRSAAEAAEEAGRRFGDRGAVERELTRRGRRRQRRARFVEVFADLLQDVRLAWRQLGRQRGFAAGVILVIALGIGATTAAFAVVDAGLFRPLPFARGDELVYVWDDQGEHDGERLPASFPEFRDWEREQQMLAAIVALSGTSVRLRTEEGWEVLQAGRFAGDLGGVTGLAPPAGRWITPAEVRARAPVAMLDEGFWRTRYGGHADAVGQTLSLGEGTYTIVGVAPRATHLLRSSGDGGAVSVWLPFEEEPWMDREQHFLRVAGRRAPGLDLDGARARTEVLAARLQKEEASHHTLILEAARPVLLGDARPILLALGGAAALVLLTVCANLGNLYLWKSLSRAREIAVRAALGASRGRIVRQVLTESVVVSLLGGVAGVALSHLVLGVTRAVADRAGALAPSEVDLRVAGFGVLMSVFVGLAFGSWPALRAARADLGEALKQGATTLTAGAAAPLRRKSLVAAEVALGVMLLAGTGLLVRSLTRMLGEDPGFEPANVVSFRLALRDAKYDDPARIAGFLEALRRRLQAVPGVVAATESSELPMERSDTSGTFEVAGRTYADGENPSAKKRMVGAGYFEAMRIPIQRGRGFLETDRAGAPDVVVISEAIAREHFPGEDPIGKRLRFDYGPGEEQEIVGVVGDVRHDGLDRPVQGTLYRPAAQFPNRGLRFLVRIDGAAPPVVAAVRREVAALDGSVPVHDVRSLEDMVSRSMLPRRQMIFVLGGFALIATLLAAVGVYAVTAQMVALRTREIGLRVACGARPEQILRLVVGEGARVIAAGAGLGVLGAMGATRVLASLLYGVSPRDPVTLLAAALFLGALAALAVYVPARRAARMDPMAALR